MSVEQFLAAVLPSQGHRFFLNTFGVQGQPDFRPMQRAYAPGREAAAIAAAARAVGRGANCYFATGGFLPPPIDPDTQKPKGGRKADRVTHFRCLRLDIDVGAEEGKYPTKRDAVNALAAFCNNYSAPLPWLVDSGYGIHAYWAFTRDVTVTEWLGFAQRLATACAAAQFKVDATTTLDASRVLRLPGTVNVKRGGSVAVKILHAAEPVDPTVLTHAFPQSDFALHAAVPASMQGAGSELQQSLHAPYYLRGVLTGCPGMSAMLADGGARAAEPLWKAALDLIHKADDDLAKREAVARAVSQGHRDFSEGAFQLKWQQTLQQDYHPPSCRTLQAAGMPECATCPLFSTIPSPLVLGRLQAPTLPDDAAVPMPPPTPPSSGLGAPPPPALSAAASAPSVFQIGVFRVVGGTRVEVADGILNPKMAITDGMPSVSTEVKQADGTSGSWMRPLLKYRIVEVERLLDGRDQRSLTAITFDRGLDKHVRIEFTNGDLTDARTFHSKLVGNGLYAVRKDVATLLDSFMPEFLAQLQRARAANQISARCGWSDDLSTFVLGTTLYTAVSSEHVRPGLSPEEMEAYHAAGDEAAWRKAFDIVISGGPDRQAVLALALASPLMVFTGLDGIMLNAFSSESGVGKSTLGDAALSIWGSPDALRKSARDTANATWRIAGITGNLPMVIDEFTNVDGKALSDFVYTMTQGREKHRLTSDARLQAGSGTRWCLAAITTANNSVHDKLQAYRQDAVAEAARVFDLRLHPLALDAERLGQFKQDLQALGTNYGFLGPRIVRLLLSQPPAYWRDRVMQKISSWDRTVALSASDRFRSATAALIEVGAGIGAAMGLAFDLPAIRVTVEREWRRQLLEFEAERRKPVDFVKGYLDDFMGEFLVVGGVNGDALVANAPRRYRGEIRGKSIDGKFKAQSVMIPMEQLRAYVRDANGNYKAFQEWLRQQLGAGMVTRIGRLVYLEGQLQQYTTLAVEFTAEILHGAVPLTSVPSPSAVPTLPAKAVR